VADDGRVMGVVLGRLNDRIIIVVMMKKTRCPAVVADRCVYLRSSLIDDVVEALRIFFLHGRSSDIQ